MVVKGACICYMALCLYIIIITILFGYIHDHHAHETKVFGCTMDIPYKELVVITSISGSYYKLLVL